MATLFERKCLSCGTDPSNNFFAPCHREHFFNQVHYTLRAELWYFVSNEKLQNCHFSCQWEYWHLLRTAFCIICDRFLNPKGKNTKILAWTCAGSVHEYAKELHLAVGQMNCRFWKLLKWHPYSWSLSCSLLFCCGPRRYTQLCQTEKLRCLNPNSHNASQHISSNL